MNLCMGEILHITCFGLKSFGSINTITSGEGWLIIDNLMGTKNKNLLVMLKTHIDSINLCLGHDVVYENLASLWVFFCNYVLYSMGLILTYIFRFQRDDRKKEHLVPAEKTKRNQFGDSSEIDGFTEELANLLFLPSCEDLHVASEEREGEKDCNVSIEEKDTDIHEDSNKKREGEAKGHHVFMETLFSDVHEDHVEKTDENETECSVFMDCYFSFHQDGRKSVEKVQEEEEEEETEGNHVFMETLSDVHEDHVENETECSVFIEKVKVKEEKEEETEETFVMDTGSATTTSKCEIGGLEEEPMTMLTFTFRGNYTGDANVSDNAFSSTANIAKKEQLSECNLEKGHVSQEEEEEEESVQEQKTSTFAGHFGLDGSDSCDDDGYLLYDDDNSLLPSDSDSESSSSSDDDLVWGNSNNNDDSVTHQIMGSNNPCEGFEPESSLEEAIEDVEETQFSCDREELCEGTMWEDKLDESYFDDDDDDDEDEDEDEWENDELVQKLKLELRNARQGGLATILEEKEEDEESVLPKVVVEGLLKPLGGTIKEKVEYKDHIVEIQKVYRCYAEKTRKLDVLNYQAMHAIGLLQLKDPLKLMLVPKSTVPYAKALVVSQNLWPRKAPKHISDPMLKLVDELHRDLELVYVGQVCLSWEILCWQQRKIQELKIYDSQRPRRYNLVAGEFQHFQVLMQRFIEDEPFQQGPCRFQNYVKNRCVIRNLLQVPAIKDDNTKDKKIMKWGEEDAIGSERLAQIIKESMKVFWEFVRADKDYGNVFHKVLHRNGNGVKDTEISDLLGDIQTQLQKKERKLKDIVRSGNCFVRKFKKHNEDQIQLDHEQLLAQVGLRLVSRVINMKKLRKDQLVWCSEKLNQINFVGRKIQVEPSFLLFPC